MRRVSAIPYTAGSTPGLWQRAWRVARAAVTAVRTVSERVGRVGLARRRR
jgi:hypothetical protein